MIKNYDNLTKDTRVQMSLVDEALNRGGEYVTKYQEWLESRWDALPEETQDLIVGFIDESIGGPRATTGWPHKIVMSAEDQRTWRAFREDFIMRKEVERENAIIAAMDDDEFIAEEAQQ